MQAHDDYLTTGQADASVRRLVLESWRRSLGAGVDPETSVAPLQLSSAQLAEIRCGHPLATAMPLIRRLLLDSVVEAGLLLALSDAAGRLLWVEGHRGLRARAEGMLFVEGADWSEAAVGTNAPGTALALDQPVQIFAAEHLTRTVTPWSCAAAPIHDPETGAVMGVLDLTGGDQVATPQSLSLVRATVAAVEAELQLDRLQLRDTGLRRRAPAPAGPAMVRTGWLEVLGKRSAMLHHYPFGHEMALSLSPRHSEIVLLLAESGEGMTAAELAVALSAFDGPGVTVRAEMSRLRAVLAPVELGSRPYRLLQPVRTDVAEVRRSLRAGDYRRAVAAYRGPILPFSQSPVVCDLRDDLHGRLRQGLLSSGDPDALLCFGDTDCGRDDLAVWTAARRCLSPESPRRPPI